MSVVGIDIGGTFTDLVHVDEATGSLVIDKVLSRPGRLHEGIRDGLASLAARHHVGIADVTTVVHGTTVATNALLESKLPRTALVVTQGFGDVLEIGTMLRPGLYNLRTRKPKPLVSRDDVVEVHERIDGSGVVTVALSDAETERVVAAVGRIQPAAVAVCLLFSFLDDRHEQRLATAIRKRFPGIAVSVSAEVDPQPREFPRANTTILNAGLNPLLTSYVRQFKEVLDALEGEQALYVMQSNGGLIPPELVARNAHRLVLSGPAGGVVAAQTILAAAGKRNLITFDMGGTSSDLCLVVDGHPALQLSPSPLDLQPIRTSSLSVHAVGAGGGSIASLDEDGVLSVGPRSAGAVPGPVCYGRGGTEPTVTDAQLVLGRLPPGGLLGGAMALDKAAAEAAVRSRIAEPLGLTLEEAALAIVDVAVATMERGLRVVSVNAGYDPQDFALVAYGGGGPLHAADLAYAVGMKKVIVPPASSAFSALGLLCADLAREYAVTLAAPLQRLSGAEILQRFAGLRASAAEFLDAAGEGASAARAGRFADMRYVGQNGVLRISVGSEASADTVLAGMAEAFLAAHKREFGHASADDPVEVVTLKLMASRPWSDRPFSIRAPLHDGRAAAAGRRRVNFRKTGWTECAVVDRASVGAGVLEGPAIVEDRESTTVLPPGATVVADAIGSLVMDLSAC